MMAAFAGHGLTGVVDGGGMARVRHEGAKPLALTRVPPSEHANA